MLIETIVVSGTALAVTFFAHHAFIRWLDYRGADDERFKVLKAQYEFTNNRIDDTSRGFDKRIDDIKSDADERSRYEATARLQHQANVDKLISDGFAQLRDETSEAFKQTRDDISIVKLSVNVHEKRFTDYEDVRKRAHENIMQAFHDEVAKVQSRGAGALAAGANESQLAAMGMPRFRGGKNPLR